MNKKIVAAFLGCAIVTGFVLPVTACVNNATPKLPVWDTNVTVTESGAEITWKAVKGASIYEVYYSPSRFGTYTLECTQEECKYKGDDKFGYYRVVALDKDEKEISSELYSYEIDTFGNNTHIYAETDNQADIQQDIDAVNAATGQFSENRFAGLFKEGEYNTLNLRMRYYMTFAGLGEIPTQTEIGGFYTKGELSGGNATCNFWCGIENMTVNSNVQWAVSQATSFRRMKVNGNLTLHDTGSTPYASGGFISDTVVTGTIDGSVQQQWFTRNSKYAVWSGSDINMVFSGCEGRFADSSYKWPSKHITELETTKVMREKPYLTFDGKNYYVFMPELKENSKGISWTDDINDYDYEGEYISLDKFYVARADRDTSATLNAALKNGKHILFTPGIYDIDSPLLVKNENTVLMGIGLASLRLTEKNKKTIMRVSDVDGVKISGIMFDAGPSSETLLEIGDKKTGVSHEDNPTVLNDVYFRIGGAGSGATYVDKTLVINSNNVVGDNFWVWRADHGNSGTVGWNINRAINGVIVNGDDVTIYGLMVEHFQQYQTIWNGENGFMAFYQSETPYDVDMEYEEVPDPTEKDPDHVRIEYTTQSKWMSEWNGVVYQGYASYKVADHVQNHTAYGIGVYYVSRGGRTFNLDHGIELPSNSGIHAEHFGLANFTTGGGTILHIVNSYGSAVKNSSGNKTYWQSFIGGVAKP